MLHSIQTRVIAMRHLLICSLLSLSCAAWAGTPDERLVRVAGDDYCPLSCNPASGQRGILIDITEQVLAQRGWRIEYVYLPWQRATHRFRQGSIDLLPGVPREGASELETARFAQQPIASPPMCFYTRSGSRWRYQDNDSLLGGRLAVIAGYYYWPALRDYLAAHREDGRVKTLATDRAMELALRGLQHRRYDYFAETRPTVEYQVRSLGLEGQIREAGCEFGFPLYLAWRPQLEGLEALIEHWDRHYPTFIDSPAGRKLLQRYQLDRSALLGRPATP